MTVDDATIERYGTDGAVAVRGLLDRSWIDLLRGAAEELMEGSYDPTGRMTARGPRAESRIRQSSGKWQECEAFRRFLFESPIAGVSASLMGSGSARLYEDLFQVRTPGLGDPAWHRDMPYWPVTGRQATNVWFTLEEVTPYTGGIHVVAGSHLDSVDQVRDGTGAGPAPASRVTAFGCEPGDVIIFHPWALHSGYGAADPPRRTFTIRFLGDDVRWRPTRSYYHDWMGETGLCEGDRLDHPGFPLVWPRV